ncbi:hypothetical protein SAMN05518801_1432 [Novosphingobium sp. CF614]|uniref:phosphoribosyltransferase-like protein n=1 Tax=Novosphingobium sp. CF614 TaxID=1884364 RepID=UPI0008F37CEE|nr:hypothetical protein [Novosphingobium sp. CF614]SFG52864.1 hypothetical protein SAMN05518801_1432 [Novosphingobium sp. CF614]
MANNPNLRAALADVIADYRAGEIPAPDAAHIDRWISQFPDAVRDPILAELLHVFHWTYFSQAKVQTFIDSIVTNVKFAGPAPCNFWQGVKVLKLQTAGNSQKDMLALLEESLQRQCGLAMGLCGVAPHTYLYLDDAVFSGGRIRSDIIKWVKEAAPKSAKLAVLVIGLHKGGEWYSAKMIREAAQAAGKTIELTWWRVALFEDRKSEINNSDVLRPTTIPADPATQGYVAGLGQAPILRKIGGKSPIGIFSGEAGRHLLEQEFLVAGVRVRGMCPHFNAYMRPLGNMLFESLGFGSTIVTYRNCPNNAPLVFWAGNPWYPLFPRKTN